MLHIKDMSLFNNQNSIFIIGNGTVVTQMFKPFLENVRLISPLKLSIHNLMSYRLLRIKKHKKKYLT